MTSGIRICVEWLLRGSELRLWRYATIEVTDREISEIERGWVSCDIELRSFLAMPPLFNPHVHPLDRAWAGYGLGSTISSLVSPRKGMKYRLLREDMDSGARSIAKALEEFSRECIVNGVVLMGAVAEMGFEGVELLGKYLKAPFIPLPQPPPEEMSDLSSYEALLRRFRSLAMNTLLDLEPHEVEELSRLAEDLRGYVQVHVSETEELYRARDYQRLPKNFVAVHCTYLPSHEFVKVFARCRAVIACPRSNALLLRRLPMYLPTSWRYGLGLGTDNAAWQDPDVLQEARFLVLSLGLDPKKALISATVAAARSLGLIYDGLVEGALPIVLLARVGPCTNPINALVLRGTFRRLLVIGKDVLDPVKDYEKCVNMLNTMLRKNLARLVYAQYLFSIGLE